MVRKAPRFGPASSRGAGVGAAAPEWIVLSRVCAMATRSVACERKVMFLEACVGPGVFSVVEPCEKIGI